MDWFRKSLLPQWSLSGVLLGWGFLFPMFWILGIVGGVYFLYLTQREQSKKSLYLGAWIAWAIKSGCAVWWFWSTYPIEWLPMQLGNIQLLLILMYWSTVSLWLGMGGMVVVSLFKLSQRFFRESKGFTLFLVFPYIEKQVNKIMLHCNCSFSVLFQLI